MHHVRNEKRELKKLWGLCFDETQDFVDLYFRQRYTPEATLLTRHSSQIVAALQMFPYPMTFCGTEIPISYISGACTHPDFRKRGIMHDLLVQAFHRAYEEGTLVSTLIPANPPLFDYYATKGYVPAFHYIVETFTTPARPDFYKGYKLKLSDRFSRKGYEYLNRKLHERPCCIQHTEKDYRTVIEGLRLDKGQVCTLKRGRKITAMALAYPEEKHGWFLSECLADSPADCGQLLAGICHALGQTSLYILTPPAPGEPSHALGMARIVRAADLLRHYAAAHPDVILDFDLTDPLIEANNGHYHLHGGHCTKNAGQLTGNCPAWSISQLAERIICASAPYMSLMLN